MTRCYRASFQALSSGAIHNAKLASHAALKFAHVLCSASTAVTLSVGPGISVLWRKLVPMDAMRLVMLCGMAGTTEPLHIKRLRVIFMMRFRLWLSALFAGLPRHRPSSQSVRDSASRQVFMTVAWVVVIFALRLAALFALCISQVHFIPSLFATKARAARTTSSSCPAMTSVRSISRLSLLNWRCRSAS